MYNVLVDASTLRTRGVGLEVLCSTRLRLVLYELLDLSPRAIIYVVYEHVRCINWFVVWKSSRVTAAFEKMTSKMVECSSLFWKSMTNSEEYA